MTEATHQTEQSGVDLVRKGTLDKMASSVSVNAVTEPNTARSSVGFMYSLRNSQNNFPKVEEKRTLVSRHRKAKTEFCENALGLVVKKLKLI
jgi:endo-1,4-beta-D-glucanase Y